MYYLSRTLHQVIRTEHIGNLIELYNSPKKAKW